MMRRRDAPGTRKPRPRHVARGGRHEPAAPAGYRPFPRACFPYADRSTACEDIGTGGHGGGLTGGRTRAWDGDGFDDAVPFLARPGKAPQAPCTPKGGHPGPG
ncbi:hypothetical protein SUDANB6_02459 [Streptomyces sp. enrichment culture]